MHKIFIADILLSFFPAFISIQDRHHFNTIIVYPRDKIIIDAQTLKIRNIKIIKYLKNKLDETNNAQYE